jgi:hypothetical protein
VDLCGVRGDDEDREQKSAEGQGSPAHGFRIIGLETPRGPRPVPHLREAKVGLQDTQGVNVKASRPAQGGILT